MEHYLCSHCNNTFEVVRRPDGMMLNCPHCNGMVLLQTDEFQPGDTIGGFEIVKLLGKGGMGYVYLARQSSMQRLVALKVIMKSMLGEADGDVIEMFNKEIQLSGTLDHPNIIKAIDAGENERCYYMAAAYVDGEDFEKVIDRGECVPEKEAFAVALKIADALNYAWERHELLHKDIKPGNIMRDRRGEVFLMDMGIAQHITLGRLRNENEVLGSPFYMSPEQGQGFPLDWRTDLYSLGATLYHMIVGVAPYDAKDVTRIVEKHVTDPFPEPADRNPNMAVSREAVAILRKMMGKRPEDRYASWKEFEDEVNAVFFSPPPPAKAPSASKNNRLQAIKHIVRKGVPRIFAIVTYALVLIAIMTGAVYFVCGYRNNSIALRSLETAERHYAAYPFDYNGALRMFSAAMEKSKGTSQYPHACRRYEDVSAKAVAFKLRAEEHDNACKKAQVLLANRKYQEAIDLMVSVNDIEDPVRRKKAETLINQIRAAQSHPKQTKGR